MASAVAERMQELARTAAANAIARVAEGLRAHQLHQREVPDMLAVPLRCAVVRDGVVENVIRVGQAGWSHPDPDVTLVESATAGIGWTVGPAGLAPPPPAAADPAILEADAKSRAALILEAGRTFDVAGRTVDLDGSPRTVADLAMLDRAASRDPATERTLRQRDGSLVTLDGPAIVSLFEAFDAWSESVRRQLAAATEAIRSGQARTEHEVMVAAGWEDR